MNRISNIDKTLILLLAVMFMSFLTFTAIVISGNYYIAIFYVLSNSLFCLALLSIVDELIKLQKDNKKETNNNVKKESEDNNNV